MKFSWDEKNKAKWRKSDTLVMLAYLLAAFTYIYSPWLSAVAVNTLFLFWLFRTKYASNFSDACCIELFIDYFSYRSLNKKYSVNINYSEISEIKLREYKSQPLVIIELGDQFQLKCPNIERPRELLKELNKRRN